MSVAVVARELVPAAEWVAGVGIGKTCRCCWTEVRRTGVGTFAYAVSVSSSADAWFDLLST